MDRCIFSQPDTDHYPDLRFLLESENEKKTIQEKEVSEILQWKPKEEGTKTEKCWNFKVQTLHKK